MTDELRLLLALCRPVVEPDRIATLAEGPIDGPAFAALVDRHRVAALARWGFDRAGVACPPAVAGMLGDGARRTARLGLLQASETVRLHAALTGAGMTAVALKGAALARLAYGTLALKAASDIDLLVARDRVEDAGTVLHRAGYARFGPCAAVALSRWHRHAKDSSWRHAGTGIVVELHTDLTGYPGHLLPGLGTDGPLQEVAVAPGLPSVATFAPEPLFAYLCVHGALSGWHRLKWLADLAALIGAEPDDAVDRLHRAAQPWGVGRAATQALALSHRLLGTPLPRGVADALTGDPATRRLVDDAVRLIAAPRARPGRAGRLFGTLPLHRMTYRLVPDARYRRAVLRGYLRSDPRGPAWLPSPVGRSWRRLLGRPD